MSIPRPTPGPTAFATFRSGLLLLPALTMGVAAYHLLVQSLMSGRLSLPAVYDDIVYQQTAINYATAFRSGGLGSLLQRIAEEPPHGPFSVAYATLAYLVSDNARWAPYACNAMLFTAIFYLGSVRMNIWWRVSLGVAVISTTFFDLVVTSFHPDLLMGMALAAGGTLLLQVDLQTLRWRDALVVASLFVTALLLKPVGFAMIALVAGAAGGMASAITLRRTGRAGLSGVLAGTGKLLCLVAIPVVPFLIWRGPALYDYFRMAILDHEHPFGYSPGIDPFLYGGYAKYAMGKPLIGFAALTWAIAVPVSLRNRHQTEGLALLAIGNLVLLAYAIPSATPVKQFYFGGVFYGLVFWTALHAVDTLARQVPPWFRPFRVAPPILVAVTMVSLDVDNQNHYPPAMVAGSQAFLTAGLSAIEAFPDARILVTAVDPVPVEGFTFEAARRGLAVADADAMVWIGSLDEALAVLPSYDLLFLQDGASVYPERTAFPITPLLDQVINSVEAMPDRQLLSVTPGDRGALRIYAKRR